MTFWKSQSYWDRKWISCYQSLGLGGRIGYKGGHGKHLEAKELFYVLFIVVLVAQLYMFAKTKMLTLLSYCLTQALCFSSSCCAFYIFDIFISKSLHVVYDFYLEIFYFSNGSTFFLII